MISVQSVKAVKRESVQQQVTELSMGSCQLHPARAAGDCVCACHDALSPLPQLFFFLAHGSMAASGGRNDVLLFCLQKQSIDNANIVGNKIEA